jgi:hypothetical protein
MLLSSVAYGATPLPEEGGFSTSPCSTGDIKLNPVTLNLYSSPVRAIPSPLNPLNLLNPVNPHAHQGVSNGDTTTLGGEGQ